MKDFLGEYTHSLDAKGRLILPADFRGSLASGAVVAPGQHNCLCVYTPEEWETVANGAREQSRQGDEQLNAARTFFSMAREVTPDGQGRVPIAPNQRTYAHLDREVVVVGVFSRIEIWDAERWNERKGDGEATLAAASLAGFGI
jgi:MraZ protein